MRIFLLSVALLFLFLQSAFSQKGQRYAIENIKVEQTDNHKVMIHYDLVGSSEVYFNVKIYLSKDNGKSFSSSPLKEVSGDVGGYEHAGKDKYIIWNVFDEETSGISAKVKFKITADYNKPSSNSYSSGTTSRQISSKRGKARWLEVRLTESFVGFGSSRAHFLFTDLSFAFCTGYANGRIFWLGIEGGYYHGLNSVSPGNPYYFANTNLSDYTNGSGSYISSFDSYTFTNFKTSGFDISGFMLLRAYPRLKHFHWDFKLSASIYSRLYMSATDFTYSHYALNASTGNYVVVSTNSGSNSVNANFNNLSLGTYFQFPVTRRFGFMLGATYSAYYTYSYITSQNAFNSSLANNFLDNKSSVPISPTQGGSYTQNKEGFLWSSYSVNVGITF